MYLTYDEYKAMGGSMDLAAFPALEFRARKRLDYLTDCRIQKMAAIPEAVRLCMFTLIHTEEKTGLDAQLNEPQISSFTTDGYSESYRQGPTAKEAASAANDVIWSMLYGECDDNGTPLLYRGIFS